MPSKILTLAARALAHAIVPLGGKRPVMLDRLLDKGLEGLGVEPTEERRQAIREALAARAAGELGDAEGLAERLGAVEAENRLLRQKLGLAEKRADRDGASLTEADLRRIRTLVTYGLPRHQAAALFGVSEGVVRSVMEGKGQVRVLPTKGRGRPAKEPPRALDLGR